MTIYDEKWEREWGAKIDRQAVEHQRGNIISLPSSGLSAAPSLSPPPTPATPEPPRLQPRSLTDFLKLDIKPREMLLDPILPQKGLAMLYGTRGTGKTNVAMWEHSDGNRSYH
jgi:hypothetical protein